MYIFTFLKKQNVIWFRNGAEQKENVFLPGENIIADILCKEENLPKHQKDPIYIYTVRNQRGLTGVIYEYLDHTVDVRNLDKDIRAA